MKDGIHPKYFQAKMTCGGCGSSVTMGSTVAEIHVNVCSECHPFYTGRQKLMDTEGRIDKFRARYAKYEARVAAEKQAAKK